MKTINNYCISVCRLLVILGLLGPMLSIWPGSGNPTCLAAGPGSIRMGWYLESGRKFNLKWPNRLRWDAVPGKTPTDRMKGVFKIWIAVPSKYQILGLEANPTELFQITRGTKDYPEISTEGFEPILFEMTALSKVSIVTFNVKDSRDLSQKKIFLRIEMDETPDNVRRFNPPPVIPARTRFRAGLQGTYVTYEETLPTRTLSQIGLTAKFGVEHILGKGLWSLEGGAFATVLPLSATVNLPTLSAVRFYGANGRLTLHPRWDLGTFHASLSLGWYFWGMLVPTANYGILSIYGPQFFANLRYQERGSRLWSVYLKIAPVVRESLNLTSREYSLGGSYQLNSPGAAHAWYVTLDLSDLQLPSDAASISSSSSSASLGISMDL